jgi:DNA invertase Pin-like site-specific DNA recombinase
MTRHDLAEEWRWQAENILPRHLERVAVVYVRPSTWPQVLAHPASTRRPYSLVRRAVALGWAEARVLVIDEDLGRSGTSVEGRHGVQRLVAEVGLDHVGLILGVEMSRLARSSKDWHQLWEICALFGPLLADLDGIDAPSPYPDRLLLGLKGTMREAELHLLKQRMDQGTWPKARRGALSFPLPIGDVWTASGEVVVDPDEPGPHVVRLVFRTFDELGTLHALWRDLGQHDLQLGVRVREGPTKGTLAWRRPNRLTLQNLLKNPLYAGAYAYGRRQVDPRHKQPGRPTTGRLTRRRQDDHVLVRDHVPASITWQPYEQHLARLAANRARAATMGAVRHGPALLAGLLVCGRCGHRRQGRDGGPRPRQSDTCHRLATNSGGDSGQDLPGGPVDTFVRQWVLKALEPAALTVSLAAATHLERERQEMDRLWQQRLERATYEAERAARHDRWVEPEPRLVARQLAQDWEEKLTAQRPLQEDDDRLLPEHPRRLSGAEREAIRQLAQNIPALWQAPTTTMADRKEMARQVVHRVLVAGEGTSERLQLTIAWVGGGTTAGSTTRPIRHIAHRSYDPQLCHRMRPLAQAGHPAGQIAERLEHEGYRPPKGAERFSRPAVLELMPRLGVHQPRTRRRATLAVHEWWGSDLARTVGIPKTPWHTWRQRGWLQARWHAPTQRWIVRADATELGRLKEWRALPPGSYSRSLWLDTASAHPTATPTQTTVEEQHLARGAR